MSLRRRAGSSTDGTVNGLAAPADDARRDRKPLTASRAKRLIGVGAAVAPLLAP